MSLVESTPAGVPEVANNNEDPPSIKPDKKYTVQTSDGQTFEILGKVAILSEAIQHAVAVCGEDHPIPLSAINGRTFKHVLKLFNMWADDSKPFDRAPHGGRGMGPNPDGPEFEYLRTISVNDELFDLCRAGGYLLSQRLTDTTVFYVHNFLKDKSIEEMCSFFGEEYDANYKPAPDAE
uniref:Skp1_POZ domain-containing protein n=1 Tax=Panagrellus redivivus TaxID=6233 RepID=A0A7E4USM9_PANRE